MKCPHDAKECLSCRQARMRAYRHAYRARHPERDAENRRTWNKAHVEESAEYRRRYKERNAQTLRAKNRDWYETHAALTKERARAWAEANPEKVRRTRDRRRGATSDVLVVEVQSDTCGVCMGPLTGARFPERLSTSVGHEPPLAVALRDGWRIVTARPEHLVCNQRKSDRTDAELASLRFAEVS